MRTLHLASGVLIWTAHFFFIYGFTGLACARGWQASLPWTVGIATLLAAAAAALVAVRGLRARDDFEQGMAAGLAGLALVAILWEGVSVVAVGSCVSR